MSGSCPVQHTTRPPPGGYVLNAVIGKVGFLPVSVPNENEHNETNDAPHAMRKATSTFFVGFRHISLCGSSTDRSALEQQRQAEEYFDASHKLSFSFVIRKNVL